jgi:hypothetical protein
MVVPNGVYRGYPSARCGLDNNSKYKGGEKLSKGEAFPTWSSSKTPRDGN